MRRLKAKDFEVTGLLMEYYNSSNWKKSKKKKATFCAEFIYLFHLAVKKSCTESITDN